MSARNIIYRSNIKLKRTPQAVLVIASEPPPTPTSANRCRALSQVDKAQIRAINKTGKFTQLQIQAMFGTDSRALAKALEGNSRATRKHDPENDDELLSEEFKAALQTGRFSVIKKFVMDSIKKQDGEKNAVVAEGSTTRGSNRSTGDPPDGKKTRMANSGIRWSFEKDDSDGWGLNGPERFPGERRALRFATLKEQRARREEAATTLTSRDPPLNATSDGSQSRLHATTLAATAQHADPSPIPPMANAAFPSASLNLGTTGSHTAGPSRAPAGLFESSRDQRVRLTEPEPLPEPQSQGPARPSTTHPHTIKPDPDQPPSNTSSVPQRPKPRDPTPDIQELPAPPNANANSSAIQTFLSSLRPSLIQYAPAFEKLGLKSSDDLLVLKGLPPASVRELLQEARKETDMTFLQSLAFINGLDQYSP
ncbi:hypothetical protein FRC01_008028 [Tulasnella sp. 417]|nr:hypothetical protein FRC01_008028 [Tulasnella sp. 417]